jgi:hypothetical protein
LSWLVSSSFGAALLPPGDSIDFAGSCGNGGDAAFAIRDAADA